MEKTKGARSMCAPLFFISAPLLAGTYQIIPPKVTVAPAKEGAVIKKLFATARCDRLPPVTYQKIP